VPGGGEEGDTHLQPLQLHALVRGMLIDAQQDALGRQRHDELLVHLGDHLTQAQE
jgi:hypothetical protein